MKQLTQLTEKIAIEKPVHLTKLNTGTWEQSKQDVEDVVKVYEGLGFGKLKPGELDMLFNQSETFMYDKITGGSAKLVGSDGNAIEIDKKEAIRIIQKPKGYEALMQQLNDFDKVCTKRHQLSDTINVHSAYNKDDISKYFEVDGNGNIDLTQELKDRIEEMGNTYITTNRGEAVFGFCEDVAKAFFNNGLHEFFSSRDHEGSDVKNVIDIEKVCGLLIEHVRHIEYDTQQHKPKFNQGYYRADHPDYMMKQADI